MICDIEGAEIEILLKDKEALNNCKFIFIELHKTKLLNIEYSVEDLHGLIESNGFKLEDRYGSVFYYSKFN